MNKEEYVKKIEQEYKTGERQNVAVVKEGSENEVFETMYRLTKGMLKQLD